MARMPTMCVLTSNDNNIGMRANKSFDKGVFFFIKAKQTHSIVRKLFSSKMNLLTSITLNIKQSVCILCIFFYNN